MSIIDVQQVLLSLLIPNAEKVKAKNTNAWALLEKWWTEIPNITVPIGVEKGAATFTADGVQKVIQEIDHLLFVGRLVAKAQAHTAQPHG